MRKLVALLAFGVIMPSVSAVLAGCGSSAPTVQNSAPTKSAAALQVAAVTAPYPADPTPTPSPVQTADDELEFAPTNSLETSVRDGGITEVDQETSQKGGSSAGPVQGQTYTWEDGDRTLTVYLQTDLVVEKGL